MKSKISILILVFLFLKISTYSQLNWEVPKEENDKISFQMFNDDMIQDGSIIYENSCASCHGTPTQEDFTLMVPSPGDPASEKFQNQTDGSIFYKIKNGKDLMPKFESAYSEDEIWNLVAFIRSFNENYKQPIPNLEGITIPKLNAELSYDENIDKLVVKVFSDGKLEEGIDVSAYIKGMFGNLELGKLKTNEVGIAYFDVDSKMPGDSLGNLTALVKMKKGYGFAKVTKEIKMGKPTKFVSAIAGRHLWSSDENAPPWLDFIFHAAVIFIWTVIFSVIYQLRKLKKVK